MYGSEWGNPKDYSRPVQEPRPRRYRSARGPARVAVWLLAVAIVANVAVLVLDVISVGLLSGALDDPRGAIDQIEQRDSLATLAVIVYWATLVPAGIAFMVWMTRAYGNVQALAPDVRRHWVGWAWLGWIIPILNFFRPKQIVNDLWRASSPYFSPPGWVLGWWALWIFAGVVERVLNRLPAESLEQIRWFDGADAVVRVVVIAAGVLAIRLVRRITELQEEHASRPKPEPPSAEEREGRTARDGEIPEGFTRKPAWAPSDGE